MQGNIYERATFPIQLAPGLHVLGNYYFNLYLVQGDQASALVEVGVSAVVDEVIRQLESMRVNPTFLVVTHPHADHATGLEGLKERYRDALVVAGEGAPEFLRHPKAVESMVKEDRHMADFLASKGLPPGRPSVTEPPSLEGCLIARDGDTMDLGGMTLQFHSVAGHSPGSIVVSVPEIRALILSDSLGFRYPARGVFPLFLMDYAAYRQALDRLEALQPAIVGVAHQGPLLGEEVGEAFRESRQEAETLRDWIMSEERDTDTLVKEIFDRYYRDECTLYTPENIMNCVRLVVKRGRDES